MSVESVNPSPSTSWISWGFSRGEAGVDRTTEGMRLCPRFFSPSRGAGVSDAVPVSRERGGPPDNKSEGRSLGLAMGSHSMPGFTMRLMVSPFWTLYSFSSLASANALPFRRRRCAEAGGACGWSAIWVLMVDMGSVGEMGIVMENGGLRDLNVIWIVLGANQAAHPIVNINMQNMWRPDAPEDKRASSFFSSGGGGTSSWVLTRFTERQ